MKLTSFSAHHSVVQLALQVLMATGIAVVVLLLLAAKKTSPSLDAELISIGIDGQAGGGDSYYVSSEIRAGAVSGYASLVAEDTNSDKDVYVLGYVIAEPPTDAEICDDGIDNDGDGLIDCLDKDCRQNPACKTSGGGNK